MQYTTNNLQYLHTALMQHNVVWSTKESGACMSDTCRTRNTTRHHQPPLPLPPTRPALMVLVHPAWPPPVPPLSSHLCTIAGHHHHHHHRPIIIPFSVREREVVYTPQTVQYSFAENPPQVPKSPAPCPYSSRDARPQRRTRLFVARCTRGRVRKTHTCLKHR